MVKSENKVKKKINQSLKKNFFEGLKLELKKVSWPTNSVLIKASTLIMIIVIFVTLYAGFALPMFTLNLAYVNDFIEKERFVAAGAGLQIIFGIGAMGGPFLCSVFMNIYGANGFFVYLAIFHLLIGLFGMYRITRRDYEDNPDSTFTPLPRNITPLGIELDPTTAADLSNTDKK